MKKNYIGPLKVEQVIVDESKTYGGNKIVVIYYQGGKKEVMPEKSYLYLVSEKPVDYSELGKKKIGIITKEVLAVLAEHDLKGEEIESISNSISNELFNSFNKATHILWTGDSKTFTPGGNSVLERSLIEAHKIIVNYSNNEEKDKD